MLQALSILIDQHPRLRSVFAMAFGGEDRLEALRSWEAVQSAIARGDALGRLRQTPLSSTERTLLAALLARADYAELADEMLEGRALSCINRLDPDQRRILAMIQALAEPEPPLMDPDPSLPLGPRVTAQPT